MRSLQLITFLFLFGLPIAAQPERVAASDFDRLVRRGVERVESGPHRHTWKVESSPNPVIGSVEVDSRRSLRVWHLDVRSRVESECIVIGVRMYHRSADYPWISQTRDEFKEGQNALHAIMKETRRADPDAFLRARARTVGNPAIFHAVMNPKTVVLLYSVVGSGLKSTVTFVGSRPHKGKPARFYRLEWDNFGVEPKAPNAIATRGSIVFAFDSETGAILSAEKHSEWISDSKLKSSSTTDEWEIDPSIVVNPPATWSEKK